MFMKNTLTKLTCLLMKTVIRLNGWTDKPKPEPHRPTPHYPWWRKLSETKIEVSDLLGAFDKSMKKTEKKAIFEGLHHGGKAV